MDALAIQQEESTMKSLHLTGKLACALIAIVAIISGCQKKEVAPPPVPEATPAPAMPPVSNTPTTEGGTATQPNPNAPASDVPPQTTPPTTTEQPPVKH